MKFLVILLCLTINYLWLKDFNRFDDSWFFRFRRGIEKTLPSKTESRLAAVIPLLFIYGIPLLVLGIVLQLLQGAAFGLPVMLLHMLVLLVAFDRTQPGNMVRCFLQHWRKGDSAACIDYLREQMWLPEDQTPGDEQSLGEFFQEQLIYHCFEKMFVMFFWYMLTGPLGVLFAYISYQLRDTRHENRAESETDLVATIIAILEWLPLRLLAITFSLAGNFVDCFNDLKTSFWSISSEATASSRLYSYARHALHSTRGDHAANATNGQGAENTGPAEDAGATDPDSSAQPWRSMQQAAIEDILALLERSQAIWLAVLALITLYGLQTG